MKGWTPDQEKAITMPTGDGNIIVSAAAGSGKTAVLVERVMRKIISGSSIDRMLIVTFTNAAAAEMRERIIKRFIGMIDDVDDKDLAQHLKEQVRLSESADIMTIDSFCIRAVQNNFHVLGADPDVGISDEGLAGLMRAEAMERVMTSLYKTNDEEDHRRFMKLIDTYASNRDDHGLEDLVLDIYKFITPFAEPEKWLDKAIEAYRLPVMDMPYAKYLVSKSIKAAKNCISAIDELQPIVSLDDEHEQERLSLCTYAETLKAAAQAIVSSKVWDEILDICKTSFNVRKSRKKFIYSIQDPCDTIVYRTVRDKLKYISEVFADQLNTSIMVESADVEKNFENSKKLAEETEDIVWLVKQFMREYIAVKDKHRVREFSDFEHMTYELFRDHEDIRNTYRDKYDEILIDEYQDTNGLQDSIFEIISNNNMFMVGDLKQSIYRFRGGDPYIFKSKSEIYGSEDTNHKKITLAQNFRSRQEVLRSVNDMFSCVMSSEAGDVDYKGDELIIREQEREYYPEIDSDLRAELHYLIVPKGSSSEQRCEEEVRFTVNKIKELLGSGVKVYDTDTGELRPIMKKDIVILENTTKNNGAMLVQELARLGIDAYCDTKMFFNRREIKVMMSLISLLNNMRQDIPLIAVMRSPIGGFSDNDLVRIRLFAGKTDCFLTAVRKYAEKIRYILSTKRFSSISVPKDYVSKKRRELRDHCRGFIADLTRWRGYVRHKSVAQLIWTIYEETYFYDIMGAIEYGEEAQFNLRLLYERAKQYERAGFKGLFNFIKYISLMEDSTRDIEGAKVVGENHDVVRVMTIHKSKGLEFPYVFLLNAGAKFSGKSDVTAVRKHKDLMLGVRDIFCDEHYTRNTVLYDLIVDVEKRENRAESMRLAYVALTRAREKLYVVVTSSEEDDVSEDDIIKRHTDMLVGDKMLPKTAVAARGMFSWLCPVAFSSENSWKYEFHKSAEKQQENVIEEKEHFRGSDELKRSVYDILNYSYPYTESSSVPSRTSVTQLKELAIERESVDAPVYEPDSRRRSGADDMAELMFSPLHQKPAFMREKGDKPANEIGTLYHVVMAEIDLKKIYSEGVGCIDDEIIRLVADEKINEDDLRYIDKEKIKNFFNSELGQRVLRSDEVHRESQFQINISARTYDPSLPENYDNETVILQGVIDCFFKEDGKYILFDYKTDHVRNGNSAIIRKKYEKQLELYRQAIEKLVGEEVKEMYLYLFDINEIV